MTYDEMRIRQAWPYEVKIAHAKKVAGEFIDKVYAGIEYGGSKGNKYQAYNVHISVGGLDSITLLLFLRKHFPDVDIPAISRSALEDKSIQEIHKQLGVQSIPGAKTKVSILRDYGFPVISKAKASKIEKLQSPNEKTIFIHAIMTGDMGAQGNYEHSEKIKLPDKWIELFGGLYADHRPDLKCQCAPFKVSAQCCYWLKELPADEWAKSHIHRIYRFLQSEQVIIDVIYTEAEEQIWRVLLEKWENHNKLQENMRRIVKQYGLLAQVQAERMARSIGVERVEIKGENWTLVNNDCVEEVQRMPDNSVGLIHTSIPFSNHYEYTPSYNDFGHNEDTVRFFEQMDYLTPELLRILKPGRVAAIHVKDRVLFGNVTGYGMPSMEPFHAQCISHYMKHGFIYFGMITVTTDVVRENNQTYRLGWTEQCKDGSKMGVGCPEYILLFRKLPTDRSKAYADERVVKDKANYPLSQWQLDAHAFWRSSGDRNLLPDELARLKMSDRMRRFREYSKGHVYNYSEHAALSYALEERDAISKEFMTVPPASVHPDVWDDISRMKTLNTAQSQRRKQLHVCPLQLDIVERVIERWSNEDDLVFDPFAGLGTVPMMAVRHGRKGYGCELNAGYFADAVGYLRAETTEIEQPSLFDLMEQEAGA